MKALALLVCRLAFAAGLIGLTILCLIPMPPSEGGYMDKFYHFAAYLSLGTLGLLGLPNRSGWKPFLLALVAWGLVIEFVQPLTGRSFEWADWLANSLGVLLAWLAVGLLQPAAPQTSPS